MAWSKTWGASSDHPGPSMFRGEAIFGKIILVQTVRDGLLL